MVDFKKWIKSILYLLGASVIIIGAIMYILSLLEPLTIFSVELHDLVLILFIVLDISWTIYASWNVKRFKKLRGKGEIDKALLKRLDLVRERTTFIIVFLNLLFAILITVTILGTSSLTFFLVSLLAILSIITIIILLESQLYLETK